LLNALAAAIAPDERLITIEDTAELRLGAPHVVRLEARPANVEGVGELRVRDLVRNALRMRPDRLIIGEVRGGEALDMLQAMNTGHEGSLSTCHANSPADALRRLETMALMSSVDLPLAAVREQVEAAVDLVVQVGRRADGRRQVVAVDEVDPPADREGPGRAPTLTALVRAGGVVGRCRRPDRTSAVGS
jgi:pilus assembly protein CpaF